MSVRVTWQPSSDADIFSYDLERGPSIGGPWTLLSNVTHTIPGPNWDAANTVFFYLDNTGTESTYYRLTAIDSVGQRSPVSTPFRVASSAVGIPNLVNTLSISVGEVSSLLDLGFTSIEVWATEDGATWTELTNGSAQPATVVSTSALNTFRLGGLYLDFQVNGGPVRHVAFSEIIVDWTPQQVMEAINAVVPGTATLDGNAIRMSSQTTGRVSSLTILNYPTEMGLKQATTFGQDSRLELVDGSDVYTYFDVAGTNNTKYKWRFSANGENPTSKFSSSVSGKPAPISNAPMSLATARFVGIDGRPVKTTILVSPEVDASSISGFIEAGQGTLSVESDDTGLWSMHLIQGARVRIAIEGTNLIRTIIVPSTASFDLLQAMADVADPYTIQSPLPLLTRRNV